MDKGIFYLVCSVVIMTTVVAFGLFNVEKVQTQCVGKTQVVKQVVVVTPSPMPTATPAAVLRPLKTLVRPTVGVK